MKTNQKKSVSYCLILLTAILLVIVSWIGLWLGAKHDTKTFLEQQHQLIHMPDYLKLEHQTWQPPIADDPHNLLFPAISYTYLRQSNATRETTQKDITTALQRAHYKITSYSADEFDASNEKTTVHVNMLGEGTDFTPRDSSKEVGLRIQKNSSAK